MSTISAPYGLQPIWPNSGFIRPKASYGMIPSAYNTSIYIGTPVKLLTTGVLAVAGATDAIIGSFAGCEYTDATGLRQVGYWPANQVATNIIAYYYDDPTITYKIQSDGAATFTQGAVGDQFNFTNPGNGSTLTANSTAQLNATPVGAGAQGVLRLADFSLTPDNAISDAYVDLIVTIAKHQYVFPQTAI